MKMLKWAILLLSITIPAQAITIDEAEDLAVKNYPLIKALEKKVQSFKEKESAAKRRRFGSLSLNANYTHYNRKHTLIPMYSMPSPLHPPPFDQDKISYGIEYFAPIYQGGKISLVSLIYSLRAKSINTQKSSFEWILKYQVDLAYLTYLALKEQENSLKSYLKSLEKLKKDVEAGIESGKFAKVDLLKVKYDISKVQSEIDKVKNEESTMLTILQNLTGTKIKVIEPVTVTIKPLPPEKVLYSQLLEKNRLIALKKQESTIAKKEVELTKARYGIRLNLYASYTRNYGFDSSENEPYGFISASVSLPVFTAGRKFKDIESARLNEVSKEQEVKAVEINLRNQLSQAISEYKYTLSKIKSLKEEVALAEETERVEQLKYDSGKGSMEHLLLAKSKRYVAEAALKAALYKQEILRRKIETIINGGEIK